MNESQRKDFFDFLSWGGMKVTPPTIIIIIAVIYCKPSMTSHSTRCILVYLS